MKPLRNSIHRAVETVIESGARKATVFVSESQIVRATLPRRYSKRDRSTTLLVTIGKPAFAERELLKRAAKKGISLKGKLHLTDWPKKKK